MIQVALPKPVISLEPLMVIGPVHDRRAAGAGSRGGRADRDRVAKDQRRQIDGKLALAVGCRHEGVRIGRRGRGLIARGRGIGTIQGRHARVGVDVAQRQAEGGDRDMGQIAALHHRPVSRVGEESPRLAAVERLIHARAGA